MGEGGERLIGVLVLPERSGKGGVDVVRMYDCGESGHCISPGPRLVGDPVESDEWPFSKICDAVREFSCVMAREVWCG